MISHIYVQVRRDLWLAFQLALVVQVLPPIHQHIFVEQTLNIKQNRERQRERERFSVQPHSPLPEY